MDAEMERIKNIMKEVDTPLTKEDGIKTLEKEISDIKIKIVDKYPNAQFEGDVILNVHLPIEEYEEYSKKIKTLNSLKTE